MLINGAHTQPCRLLRIYNTIRRGPRILCEALCMRYTGMQQAAGTATDGGEMERNMLNIVLYEPEKPANTGNIGRTCVAVGAKLHLIEPISFSLSDSHLKRAGMYHWKQLEVERYSNFQDFLDRNPEAVIFPVETSGKKCYCDVSYPDGCFLMFGKESSGIPEEIVDRYPDTSVRIPMKEGVISMNLSDCASIVLFEALRQQGYPGLR